MGFEQMKREFKALSNEDVEGIIRYYWKILPKDYAEYEEKYDYVTNDIIEELEIWFEENKEREKFVYGLLKELNEKEDYPLHIKKKVMKMFDEE